MEGETTYTIEEAAELLQETPERVEEMLNSGELDGIPPGATLSGEWKVLLPTSLREDPHQEAPVAERSEGLPEVQDEAPVATDEEAQVSLETSESASEERVEPADSAAPREAGVAPVGVSGEVPDESPREPDEDIRGDAGGSGWTTTKQAAKVLGVSRRSVQGYVRRGLLEAQEEGEGVNKTFLISIDSLNALRDRRSREASATAKFTEASAEEERSANLSANTGEALRHAIDRVEARTAEATELRVRLEITEKAESTLRAELEEARRRHEEVERERDQLRRELEALKERRESPVSPGPTEMPTAASGGAQEAREATQSAAETLKGPQPPASTPGSQVGPQIPPQPARRRGPLWRRVFGR